MPLQRVEGSNQVARVTDKSFSLALATILGALIRARYKTFEAAAGPCGINSNLLRKYADEKKPQQPMPDKAPTHRQGAWDDRRRDTPGPRARR